MVQLLIIAALVVYCVYQFKLKNLPAAQRHKLLLHTVMALGLGVMVLGAATGHLPWLAGLAAALFGVIRFGLLSGLQLGRFWMAKTGGVARFTTDYLDITFNAASMEIQGRIKKGLYASKELNQLNNEQLQELAAYYQDKDSKSYYLIKALLQRRGFGGAQTENLNHTSSPEIGEALDILGLTGQPSREEIINAHRRLINKLHPDRGGSDYLASQVNLARDQLLKHWDTHNQ